MRDGTPECRHYASDRGKGDGTIKCKHCGAVWVMDWNYPPRWEKPNA